MNRRQHRPADALCLSLALLLCLLALLASATSPGPSSTFSSSRSPPSKHGNHPPKHGNFHDRPHPHHPAADRFGVGDNPRNFTQGTSPHLKDEFIGRCYAASPNDDIDCSAVWLLFEAAVRFKADMDTVPSDFDAFFKHPDVMAAITPPRDTALFWSGVVDVVDTYQWATGHFIMEISPLVGAFQDLMWCGSPDTTASHHHLPASPHASSTLGRGWNDTFCVWGDYNATDRQWHGAWVAFWAAASIAYSPLAQGNVTMFFAGPVLYRPTSFFALCELPRLNAAAIDHVHIIVAIPGPGQPPTEQCGTGSLAQLVADLGKQGISADWISCTNADPVAVALYCLRNPTATRCQLTNTPLPIGGSAQQDPHHIGSTTAVVAVTVAMVACLALVLLSLMR